MQILRDTRPEQATLVPDAPDAFTSEEGWELDPAEAALASRRSPRCKRWAAGSSCSSTRSRR